MTNEPTTDRLRELFDAAFDLPAAERAALLARECAGEPALQQRLEQMLAAAEADDFLSAPPESTSPGEEIGSTIGNYRLVEKIGEGGFGDVFRAEQTRPVTRQVALKIVKLGMDTRAVVARFEQERQALALMDHPNIARVFDAGATATGRPYFIMELVAGEPIVRWCDRNRLGVRERLALFAQVCRAVQHAHGRGIIHRDLKPSNVLVAEQDGVPTAKVIDFGIAKATSRTLAEASMVTAPQQVIGTLLYMSPEQASGSNDLDTRTDVYSLGVLLYELLTGATPLPRQRLRHAMLDELQRMVREVDPPRPSAALTETTEDLAAAAHARRSEPRRLGLQLRGDLDWIVMKALEKDRRRRYETVEGLAADVLRHLAGEAVTAAPPSAAYRAFKAVRRNRGLFAAAATTFAALAAGVVAFAWQASVATQQRDRASAVTNVLLETVGATDVRGLGPDARVAQVLDRLATTAGQRFATQPAVQAELRIALARSYLSLGLADPAHTQVELAIEQNRRLYGDASAEFAAALDALAEWQKQKGLVADEVETRRRLLAIARDLHGTATVDTFEAQRKLGEAMTLRGDHDAAQAMLREALAGLEQHDGDDDEITLAQRALAASCLYRHQLEEAERLQRAALLSCERRLGPDHFDTLATRAGLAGVLRERHRDDEARQLFESVYAALRSRQGEDHVETSRVAWNLAMLQFDAGHDQQARELLEDCIAIRTRVRGDDDASLAEPFTALGHCLVRLGDPNAAATAFERAAAIDEATLGAEHQTTLTVRVHLADALFAAGRAEPAANELLGVVARAERSLGPGDALTLAAKGRLATTLLRSGRKQDGVQLLEATLEAATAAGAAASDLAPLSRNLAVVLRELGRHAEAERVGRRALELTLETQGPDAPETAMAHAGLGEALLSLGRGREAGEQLAAAVRVHRRATGRAFPRFAAFALAWSRPRIEAADVEQVLPLLTAIEAAFADGADPQPDDALLAIRTELARATWRGGDFATAAASLLAIEARFAARSEAPRELDYVRRSLAELYAAWHEREPSAERREQAEAWRQRSRAPR